MKKIIDKFLAGFQRMIENHFFYDKNIICFRRCVYSLLLIKMLFIWPEISMFYRHAISVRNGSFLPHELIFLPVVHNYYKVYWFIACLLVALALFYKKSRGLYIAVFIVSVNYIFVANKATNSGDGLLNFLIFMLIFVRGGATKYSINQMINNVVLILIQVYFCLFYFFNALGKIIQPLWRNGDYFKHAWHLSYYANPAFIPHWFFNPTLQLFTAWSVMLFEFIFPVLIWFKPYRKLLLAIGILFHFGIAILLSLPDFGLTMAIIYILFYDFKQKHDSHSQEPFISRSK